MVDGDFKKFEGKWSVRSGPRWASYDHFHVLFVAYDFDEHPACLLISSLFLLPLDALMQFFFLQFMDS